MSSSAPVIPTTAPPSSGVVSTTTAPPSTVVSSSHIVTTLSLPTPQLQSVEPTAEAFGHLAAAIYAMQRQIGDLSMRMSSVESRPPVPPMSYPYGLPGYGGIPALPPPAPVSFELFSVPPFQTPVPAFSTPPTTLKGPNG